MGMERVKWLEKRYERYSTCLIEKKSGDVVIFGHPQPPIATNRTTASRPISCITTPSSLKHPYKQLLTRHPP